MAACVWEEGHQIMQVVCLLLVALLAHLEFESIKQSKHYSIYFDEISTREHKVSGSYIPNTLQKHYQQMEQRKKGGRDHQGVISTHRNREMSMIQDWFWNGEWKERIYTNKIQNSSQRPIDCIHWILCALNTYITCRNLHHRHLNWALSLELNSWTKSSYTRSVMTCPGCVLHQNIELG